MSKFQKCKGTSFDEDMELDDFYISTASAEAELHAAADTLKLALHTARQRSDPLGFRPYRGTGGYVRRGFAGGFLEVPGGFPGCRFRSPVGCQLVHQVIDLGTFTMRHARCGG